MTTRHLWIQSHDGQNIIKTDEIAAMEVREYGGPNRPKSATR